MRGYLPFGLSLDKSITVHLALGWYNEEDYNDNFATTDNWLQYRNNYQLLALTVDLARDHFPWAVFSIRLGTNLIIRQICIKPAYHTLSLIGHGWYLRSLRSEFSFSDCQYTNSDLQVFHRFNRQQLREAWAHFHSITSITDGVFGSCDRCGISLAKLLAHTRRNRHIRLV